MIWKSALCSAGLLVAFTGAVRAEEPRSIALILDASGSMNAALASGETRIDAAKSAVGEFIANLASDVRISFRVYGHQSPTKEHNCKDTELMVGFETVAANRDAIVDKTQAVNAQGYTPITYVIQLAAADIAKEPGRRTVVLVSDGKETCEGDPCAAAKALADADAELVIHTIGFNVDAAARFQLQCMAKVARGTYSDASGAADLGAKLGEAALARSPPQTNTTITIKKPKPGRLEVKNAAPAGHKITEASTGKEYPEVSSFQTIIELPVGFYNVSFGPTVWKSVEIRAGETTVLDPGTIEVKNASPSGHKVLDWETGVEVGEISSFARRLTVLPSTFTVTFGSSEWRNIEVKAGEHKVLDPAVIGVNNASAAGHKVYAEDGTLVGEVSSFGSTMPVPPGKYTITFGGVAWKMLSVKAGEQMVLNPAVIAVNGASAAGHKVYAENGTLVGDVSSFVSRLTVPPGKYTIEIGEETIPLDLEEGQVMEINVQ